MVKFTPFEVSTELLHQKSVACHVCILRIPISCALLHYQIGVPKTFNVLNTDFLCKLDAMHMRHCLTLQNESRAHSATGLPLAMSEQSQPLGHSSSSTR